MECLFPCLQNCVLDEVTPVKEEGTVFLFHFLSICLSLLVLSCPGDVCS